MIRRILARLAGHDPATLDQHGREDQAPIIHLGWTVLVGACIAGVNWAVGGYVFAGGAASPAAVGTAVAAGMLGSSLVVIIDRSAIYHIDTHAGRWWALLLLAAFRIALTCGVSSITAHAVVPILLKPELEWKSLQLIEEAERKRGSELAARYNLAELQSAETAAEAAVRNARQAVQIVPPDIKARLDAAKACWAGYTRRRANLIQQGMLAIEARRRLAPVAAGCTRDQAVAQELLDDYGKRARSALRAAEERFHQSGQALIDTRNIVAEKSAYAAEIEQRAITPLSSTVLRKLLETDAGAFFKYWTVFGLVMGLELMPLLAKLISPRSVPGTRIATDLAIAKSRHSRRRKAALEEDAVEQAIRSSMAAAMTDALTQPELHKVATRIFAAKIQALVPIEAFQMLMREIEARELDVQSVISRYPSYAKVLTEAWKKTIDEVGGALRNAPPYPQPEAAWWKNDSKEAA
ncbi:DUF4407 domain-containing protein [Bradyrhizobium sp. 131]|uniref:DUF4407 domain-containing protein n=1 Tax=Bradyrhizobium sp. 131 TaxID=2782609 RepID=UPI0020004086|nr:DUF4407 domain-containing protein [Bradyrhizobium sp. 131]UPK23388.1 DUF4407 domain-containing protein [Bradyrhizobium sp. 131]